MVSLTLGLGSLRSGFCLLALLVAIRLRVRAWVPVSLEEREEDFAGAGVGVNWFLASSLHADSYC